MLHLSKYRSGKYPVRHPAAALPLAAVQRQGRPECPSAYVQGASALAEDADWQGVASRAGWAVAAVGAVVQLLLLVRTNSTTIIAI